MYKPKKFLGQNFLTDENIARKIVKSLGGNQNDTVIEIGPGQGVLTKYLLEQSRNFYAVEIDRHICEKLSSEYGSRLNLIHRDFLKFDFGKDIHKPSGKIKIIGNIPYNITSGVLFKIFDAAELIHSAVLMMQKEVAKRIVSKPGTKEYGILAVQTQLHSKPEILFDVPPTAFFPKPKVFSSVVRLVMKDEARVTDKELFTTIVRESFGKRRKTMRNSLKSFFEAAAINENEIDFDFSRRPESVRVEEFVQLTNEIHEVLSRLSKK